MVTYIAPPSSPRHVSFMPIPIYSRQPRDDELYVMRRFERHAGHCSRCYDPLRSFRRGSTLCAKGHAYAADVAQYVYNKEGRAYSLVDRKKHQRVRLELPADCLSLRRLLRAWEEGMNLMETRKVKVAPAKASAPPKAHHTRTPSYDSSDYEVDYIYPEDVYYFQPSRRPDAYASSSPAPVYYEVVSPSSPGRATVYYPR